ncbi:MAG: DUF2470 domain-containing protein [Acidithiobacillus sp.]|nr:DUF2470 domain-containing protein [Acidithiobacillus sp.]
MKGNADSLRAFVRAHYQGALAVLDPDSHPYTAVVHYACDHPGLPHFLFSDLAVHQQYLQHNPKAALLVWDAGPDLMAEGRLSLQGEVQRVHPDPALEGRLLCLLPGSDAYREMPDFHFYRFQVHKIRWIAGFGSMGWQLGEEFPLAQETRELELAEAAAVAHMNADHGSALRDYWRYFTHSEPQAPVRLLALDAEGADLAAGWMRLRIPFVHRVDSPEGWRKELVALAQRCRHTEK